MSSDLVRREAGVSATDDSAPVTSRVSLITHRLHMLPIKIRRVGARLKKSTHLVTLSTSVDKALNTYSTGEEGGRTVRRGGEETHLHAGHSLFNMMHRKKRMHHKDTNTHKV